MRFEKGILKRLSHRLWFRIFINVGLIFAAFVLVLTLTNGSLLVKYYSEKQKRLLAGQTQIIASLDISDETQVTQTLSDVSDRYNFEVEIYGDNGTIYYTTSGNQMMDFFAHGRDDFKMQHERLISIERERLDGGIIFEQAKRRFGNKEFLVCTKQMQAGVYAELRIQKELITSSAAIANEFITIIALICFFLSVIWILIFARRFSRPISRMNDITRNMARLDFSQKLDITERDEIGQLAVSINEMSDSLSTALSELKSANEQLKGEIEAERQLDSMRKTFVANVSHELKTPISIISGYAEGLKLNINSSAREEYCNTIIDESRRMNELVLSILDLSKYESGQIKCESRRFSLEEVIPPLVTRIFSGKCIRTDCENGISLCVYADLLQTEQALKVYLENAASHVEECGEVKVSAEQNGDVVRINVYNSGSHIESEQMPQIWQSFFRGDTSHKRDSSRFGLGLSIVTAICRAHGTDCGVYNTQNGVCFWIELPTAEEDHE